MTREEIIRNALPIYKDWPKQGINYLNTVDLCTNPVAFRESVDFYYNIAALQDVDLVLAADARGFIWGSPVALRLGIPLHTVRKKGKMPGDLISREYQLEYGTDTLELRKFNYKSGTIMIVDDVLATGGTAEAICHLAHDLGISYQSMHVACLINITFLNGANKLRSLGVNVHTLINVNA
ncbi:adenine phosphoribosyltransferase [bacterium]|nr:adenine phosphoribosyltransferase [Candidatus Elulimicrobium humile]